MTIFWIILAIYAVSIPISVGCGFFSVVDKPISKEKNEILLFIISLLIVSLISPVVALISPIILFKKIRRERRERIERLERDAEKLKVEKERASLISETNAILNTMESYVIEENDPLLSIVTNKIFAAIKNKKYEEIFNALNSSSVSPDVIIFEGGELKVELCKSEGHGDISSLYIEDCNGKDENVFSRLLFRHNVSSVWKAYLVDSLTYCLPHFWHAIYASRHYIFTFKELEERYKEHEDINSDILLHDVRPKIYFSGCTNYVVCFYWNSWRGLVKETVRVDIAKNGQAYVQKLYDEVLYEYDCGIIF